jgi:hypothetical protein
VTFVSRHQYGYLTVLQDRAKPTGRTIRLLTVMAWPVGVDPLPGMATGFGGNIGDPRSIDGGIAPGATRLGRIVVQLESRGAGPHVTTSTGNRQPANADRDNSAEFPRLDRLTDSS